MRQFFFLFLLSLTAFGQSTMWGTGSGGGNFIVGQQTAYGPPLYLGSSTSTANPGTIAPIFTSRAPVGVVNTGTPDLKAVNWVSGDKFDSGNCTPGYPIRINTTQFTVAICDSATQLHLTANTNVFSGLSFVLPAVCIGDCQNSVKEDITIPGHIAGTEKISRINDGATMCSAVKGQSVGNLTGGGDNDRMISLNSTYLGVVSNGAACIYHLSKASGKIQVVNSGATNMIRVGYPFEFSWTVDTRFFYVVSKHQIWQGDITSDTTFTATMLVDLTAPGVCPGIPQPFSSQWIGIMGVKDDDSRFGVSIGPNGQGNADWVFFWDQSLGCATTNMNTGHPYNWSSIVCPGNTCSSSTASLGTFSTGSTNCWGSNGSSGNGIHDSQMSGDGNFSEVSVSGTWTKGGCAGLSTPGAPIITPASLANVWCQNVGVGTLNCGAHESLGISKMVTPSFNGPNIRSLNNIAAYTQFVAPINAHDMHGSWPHNCNGTLDDNCPWINASDQVTPALGGVYAPLYQNNVVMALFPYATYPPGKIGVFFHTYECGPVGSTFSQCTDGISDGFGPANAIGVASPSGDMFCWVSTHLHNTGLDNLGKPRADAYCGLIQ